MLCFQETKWNEMNLSYVLRVLPSFFVPDVVYFQVTNGAGGCLIAWKRTFSLINSWTSHHSCTAIFRRDGANSCFAITNVYGPSADRQKELLI